MAWTTPERSSQLIVPVKRYTDIWAKEARPSS
jgi:hypothetical protein